MVDKQFIAEHLSKVRCQNCRMSMEHAELTVLTDLPTGMLAQAKCINCETESMLTITLTESGISPIYTDLTVEEIKNNSKFTTVTIDDVLEVHKILKKKPLWKLLQQKETFLEKK